MNIGDYKKVEGIRMQHMGNELTLLNDALIENQPVVWEPDGFWYIEGSLRHRIRNILNLEENRIRYNAKSLSHILDNLETNPIRFGTDKQKLDFTNFLTAARTILKQIKPFSDPETVKQKNALRRRLVALKYRLEGVNGGLSKSHASKHLWTKLIEIATQWKLEQTLITDKPLNDKEINRLKEASFYPGFVDLLSADPALEQSFMSWILRDNITPGPFIEFPATQNLISDSQLAGRIGRLGGDHLKIKKISMEAFQQKVLTLPMDGIDTSILDRESPVVFKGNLVLTVEQIFEIFKNKNLTAGDLEFMGDGIINWNVHQMGWWNAQSNKYERVDITRRVWWKELPHFELLTREQAESRYNCKLDGRQWSVAACASRGSATLDFNQTHAFIEVAVPVGKDIYLIYDFGKFATYFPKDFLDTLSFFCTTAHAAVAYPDENVFYSHRQHGNHSFLISPEEGFKLMDSIREDIRESREGNFVYQIESENCAKWSFEKLTESIGEARVPNLFKMSLLDTEPEGFVGKLFQLIKSLPDPIRVPFLTLLHLPLGASKGIWVIENGQNICKNLTTHDFWKTGSIYLPAMLLKRKELGHLSLNAVEFPRQQPPMATGLIAEITKPFKAASDNPMRLMLDRQWHTQNDDEGKFPRPPMVASMAH